MASQSTAIEVQVNAVEQLFNRLDPFPFLERDLDRSAEEYIVGWARELPASKPIAIVIHLPRSQAEAWRAADIEAAFHSYFAYRAEIVGRDLSELFRIGRRSLQIGLTVLLLSVILREISIATIGRNGIAAVLNESLIILGWVANWRPIEIFLYSWWPIANQRRLYRRLAEAGVSFAAHDDATPPAMKPA
jgi:hypothetical protein